MPSISVRWFGAKGDVATASVTASSGATSLTISGLTSANNGQTIKVKGGGSAGVMYVGTIGTVSGTTVPISPALGATVTSQPAYWGTNDTAAIASAITASVALGAPLYIPAATYFTDKITLSGTHRGLRILGDNFNPQKTVAGLPPSKLMLRTAATALLELDNAAYFQEFHSLAFDGGELPTAGVISFPGVSAVSQVMWRNCLFMGAACIGTKTDLWHISGPNQVDNMRAENCMWMQNPDAYADYGRASIWNSNGNAFNITIRGGYMDSMQYHAKFTAGSCNLHHVQMFRAWIAYVRCEDQIKPFEMVDLYNELTPTDPGGSSNGSIVPGSVPFLQWYTSGTGVNSESPVVMRNCIVNGEQLYIDWNCQAPLIMIGNTLNGNCRINPMATYGTCTVTDVGNTFNNGYGYTGTGVDTNLDRIASYNAVHLSPTTGTFTTRLAKLFTKGKLAVGSPVTAPPNAQAIVSGEVMVDPAGASATNGGALRFAANVGATSFMGSNQYYNAGFKRARSGGAGTYQQDTSTGSSAGDHQFTSAATGAADSVIADAEVFRIFSGGGIRLGPAGAPKVLTGTGTPQSVVVADIGSIFLRSDGGTSTTLYVKEAGNGLNTGWVAK